MQLLVRTCQIFYFSISVLHLPNVWAGSISDPVLKLNRLTFDGNVLAQQDQQYAQRWIVLFCYPWYEECQEAEIVFRALAGQVEKDLNKELTVNAIRFAQVDCSTDRTLCNTMGVDEYPFVGRYFANGTKDAWTGRFYKKSSHSQISSKFISFIEEEMTTLAYGEWQQLQGLVQSFRKTVRKLGNHQSGDAALFTMASVGLVAYCCFLRLTKNDNVEKPTRAATVPLDTPMPSADAPAREMLL